MKKLRRFLAMLLTLLLCVGEFAAMGLTVHAANEYDLWVGGVRVTDDNKDDIGGVTGDGAKASYDPDTKTLSFKNVTGFAGTQNDAYIYTKDDLTIEGNVSADCDYNYGILTEKSVTIKGDVDFDETDIRVEDLIIDGGSLSASNNDIGAALNCSNLWVKSGKVAAGKGNPYPGGAISVKNLKIEDGSVIGNTVYYDTAVYVGKLTMTGGLLYAGNDDCDGNPSIIIGEITSEESIVVQKPVGGKVVKGSSGYWIADSEGNTAHDVILIYGEFLGLWVGGIPVTSTNKDDIPGVTGEGAKASYDPDTQTLTFENVTGFAGTSSDAYIYTKDDLTIEGNVSADCDYNYGILAEKSVTIKGDVDFDETDIRVEDLIIEGGSLSASNNDSGAALNCSNLWVKSGKVAAGKGNPYPGGAISVKNLKIEDGSVMGNTAYYDTAVYVGKLTMTGGSLYAGNDDCEGNPPIIIGEITSADLITVETPVGGQIIKGDPCYWIADSEGNNTSDVILKGSKDYNLWVGDKRVTYENKDDILGDGKASFDPTTQTLSFDNATIATAYDYKDGRKAGIYAEKMSLTIDGKVSIVPEGIDSTFFGVYLKGTGTQKLTFDGDVTISGYNNGVLGENAEIVIADGKVDIDSKKCAYQSNVGITLGEDVEVLSPAGTEFKVLDGYYFLVDSASGTRIAKATIGTTKESYTVTFNKNGHGDDIAAATVKEGENVSKPEAPTAAGWVFGGWYTDADCTTEYDFTKAVTGDLELYAKWTKEKIDVSGVTLDKTAVSLVEEETVTLEATVAPDDATDKTVTWSSNKTGVATVDADGKVTAVKAGTATITATATNGTDAVTDDQTATCTVTVTAAEEPKVDVTGVTLNKITMELTEGTTGTLTATVVPTDASDKTVIWSSDKTSVATVDTNGKVTAVKAGTAIITVMATNGTDDEADDKTATCTVTVTAAEEPKVDVTGVTLNKTALELTEGTSGTLTATVAPEDATDTTVTWKSSDEAVATVDNSGKVTAVAAGSAKITATATNGTEDTDDDKTATCTVTVTEEEIPKVDVTGVTLNKTALELTEGTSGTLMATVAPEDATDATVTWKSDDTGVATVDNSGKVTAIKAGTATITVTATNGTDDTTDDKTATCKVTVKEAEVPKVDVSGVSLNKTTLELQEGKTGTLTATVAPEDATDATVTWKSDDTGVATVNNSGKVTAVKAGTATITVTATNGTDDTKDDQTATCTVTVTEAEAPKVDVSKVTLDQDTVSLTEGEKVTLEATVAPDDATDKTVTCSSDKESVATVDESGVVTAVKAGTATITVTATNGTDDTADDKTATCTVTVTEKEIPKVDVSGVTLNKTELTLQEGKTGTLIATVAPEDAACKDVIWSSGDKTVAIVDADGVVAAMKAGTATITVTATNGTDDTADDKTATCKVTVTKEEVPTVDVTGVILNKAKLNLTVGATSTLTAYVKPVDAADPRVSWSSTDESVATVDENGKVMAVSEGTTSITVKTVDGGFTASCEVNVTKEEVKLTGISIDPTELKLEEGETATLIVGMVPEDATEQKVVFSSSDEAVATVDAGGKVTAAGAGTATITVKTEDEAFSVSCEVTVEAKTTVTVTGVSLNKVALELAAGKTAELVATVAPEDAPNKDVTWSSDKPAVATVDENGKVTAVAAGEATITVTTVEGEQKASCTVNVVKKTEISANTFSLKEAAEGVPVINNSDYTLIVVIDPENGAIKSATIYGPDGKVATEIDSYIVNIVTEYAADGKTPKTFYSLVFTDGRWDTKYDSATKGAYEYKGVEYFVAGGVVNQNANGLIYTGADGWRFLAAGHVVTDHEGLVMYANEWFWIDNDGKCDDTYAAIVKWNGADFLVHGGRLRTDYTGFTYDPQNTSKWYHITAGQVWGEGEITDQSIEGGEITRNVVKGAVQ